MQPARRFLAGLAVGAGALGAYLFVVGPGTVLSRAASVAPWAVTAVLAVLLAEVVVDGLGVWASVRPLGTGLSGPRSVVYAVAGDFFDTVSPAGPVSSEPIMAHFFAEETGTTYGEALGARGAAKYVKSGVQLGLSTALVLALFLAGSAPRAVVWVLGGAALGTALAGVALVWAREHVSGALVAALGPVVGAVPLGTASGRAEGRTAVAAALDRFWARTLYFGSAPGLVGLIALSGVLEQVLTAAAVWVALVGTGATGSALAFLPVLAVVPLPQVASLVPVPGSVGAYEVLMGGALAVIAGVPATAAVAAVLVVRTFALGVSLSAGGLATGAVGHRVA